MDKKVPILIVGVFVLLAGGILAGFLVFMQPKGGDSSVQTDAAFHFPAGVPGAAQQPEAPEGAEGTAQMMSDQAEPSAPGGGSLGFLKKDANVVGGSGGAGGFGGGSQSASEAAARGDAGGLMNELKKGDGDIPDVEGGAEKMSGSVTRALMQRVVDKVKRYQPKWYQEFLSYKDCKGLADRYDKSKDFKGFVRDLHQSKSFHNMLKKYYKTKTMRGLTKSLIDDQSTGPQILQLFGENAKDPNMLAMVKTYGADAGLPPEMVAAAGSVGSGIQAVLQPKAPRPQPAVGSRPKLKNVGFGAGNFGGKQQQGQGGAAPQMPEGMDPEMMKKLQQQYMQK